MFLLQQILPAAVIAMVVAAGVSGVALFWGKERTRGAFAPLAIGIAYFAGHLFVAGRVSFPPTDTTNWLPYFALATAVLGAFCALWAIKSWSRALIFAVVAIGALRLLLRPKFQYGWSPGTGWMWVAGLGAAMLLLAIILDALLRRSSTTVEVPVFLLVVCAGTFGALMLSGSVLLGQLAAVLGAAVFGTLVFAVRQINLGRGIVPVSSLLLGTLLVSGYFFAELPAASALLLGFAPVLALAPISPRRKLLAFAIRTALVSAPVAAALIVAFRSSPPLSD